MTEKDHAELAETLSHFARQQDKNMRDLVVGIGVQLSQVYWERHTFKCIISYPLDLTDGLQMRCTTDFLKQHGIHVLSVFVDWLETEHLMRHKISIDLDQGLGLFVNSKCLEDIVDEYRTFHTSCMEWTYWHGCHRLCSIQEWGIGYVKHLRENMDRYFLIGGEK